MNASKIAAQLFSELSNNAGELGNMVYEEINNERAELANEFASKYQKLFAKALNEDQREAFWRVVDLTRIASSDNYDRGFAAGILTAKGLFQLINDPANAYSDAICNWTDVRSLIRSSAESLDAYLFATRINNREER